MSTRMELLEELLAKVTRYTNVLPMRPGISDLWTYDTLLGMHESDYEDVNNLSYIWLSTPDVVMESIIDEGQSFSLDFGTEQCDETIRDYLIEKGFVVYADDVDEETYKTNLERGM